MINIVNDVDITTHWWNTAYPFVVRVSWKQWVLVEAYFKTREERDEYAKTLRNWKDAGKLAVSHSEHGIPYLEYIQQRSGDRVLLQQFSFLGGRKAPRWCSVKWIEPFTEERKRELEEARSAPEMLQEIEDDRLFWEREVRRCVNCGRKQVVVGEGREIDGSWPDDERLTAFRGSWVCCYRCYDGLLRKANAPAEAGIGRRDQHVDSNTAW